MISYKFIQLTCPQLDNPDLFSDFNLNAQIINKLNNELVDNLVNLLANISNYNVDQVLIPGGIFDTDNVKKETIVKFTEIMSNLPKIKFYIAPMTSSLSNFKLVYDNQLLMSLGLKPWSDNVSIFNSTELNSITLPNNIFIHGANFNYEHKTDLNFKANNGFNILMLPVPIGKYYGNSYLNDLKFKYNYDSESIKQLNYNYIALGTYLENPIINATGVNMISSANTYITSKFIDDLSNFCLVTVSGDNGSYTVEHKPIYDSWRKIIHLSTDVSSLSSQNLVHEIEALLNDAQANKESDLVLLRIYGHYDFNESDYLKPIKSFLNEYFYCEIINEARPDYLAQEYAENSLNLKYIEEIKRIKKDIDENFKNSLVNTDKELVPILKNFKRPLDSMAILDDALFYGLDALNNKKIRGCNVD